MKNQKNSFFAFGIMILGLIACNSESSSDQTEPMSNTAPIATTKDTSNFPSLSSIPESTPPLSATIPPPTSLNAAGQLATSSAPLASLSTPQAAPSAPINTPKATTSSARLNPAHGQPGHDCAIPVGAPLKSTVAAKPTPAPVQTLATSTPVETKTATAPALVSGPSIDPKAKINPAHGQPGHDCAVAVGAPLPVK